MKARRYEITDFERGVAVGVRASDKTLQADRVVLCLGSYSAPMGRTFGLRLPIYPEKGYSATVQVDGWNGYRGASTPHAGQYQAVGGGRWWHDA